MPVWVLDTNVVVSGLLSTHGPPGRLVDAVLSRALALAYDDRIRDEYVRVTRRPAFRMDRERLEAFFAVLPFQHHVSAPPWTHGSSPDPEDTKFLEVAATQVPPVLVTGNLRHFPDLVRGPVTVLSPAEAWGMLARAQ